MMMSIVCLCSTVLKMFLQGMFFEQQACMEINHNCYRTLLVRIDQKVSVFRFCLLSCPYYGKIIICGSKRDCLILSP